MIVLKTEAYVAKMVLRTLPRYFGDVRVTDAQTIHDPEGILHDYSVVSGDRRLADYKEYFQGHDKKIAIVMGINNAELYLFAEALRIIALEHSSVTLRIEWPDKWPDHFAEICGGFRLAWTIEPGTALPLQPDTDRENVFAQEAIE